MKPLGILFGRFLAEVAEVAVVQRKTENSRSDGLQKAAAARVGVVLAVVVAIVVDVVVVQAPLPGDHNHCCLHDRRPGEIRKSRV